MLREDRAKLQSLSSEEFKSVAEELCYSSPSAFLIHECVKVFARLTESGEFTYARSPQDLGTVIVPNTTISGRMKDPARSGVVLEALQQLEQALKPVWPFAPGSSSWIQVEILHPSIRARSTPNNAALILRKACRISSTGGKPRVVTSPLVEKVFKRFESSCPQKAGDFLVLVNPRVDLKNVAGRGIATECITLAEEGELKEASETLSSYILKENNVLENSPGLSVDIAGKTYRIVSSKYTSSQDEKDSSESKSLGIPIAGWVR